jgi:alkyl hydroperoxide reductase subunit AhpF
MALLSPADQQKLRDAFNEMTSPVRLLFFTQALECETCPQTKQILDELPPLSDKITVEEVNFVLEGDRARAHGIDRAPGVVLEQVDPAGNARDARIRFIGAPSGYEFISLVQAVLLVGGRPSSLTDENRQRVMAVNRPVHMQVFTTPT